MSQIGRKRGWWLTALGMAMLLLTSCTAEKTSPLPTDTATSSSTTNTSTVLAPYLHQKPNWRSCYNGSECAFVRVPLDWNKPSADSITVNVLRQRATGKKTHGTIVLQNSDEGVANIATLKDSMKDFTTSTLRKNFDLVTFDQRGTGSSTPVNCGDDKAIDNLRTFNVKVVPDKDRKAAIDRYTSFNKACKQNTGRLLGNTDTISATKDLEIIRTVLGEKKLNFLGTGYGTLLGLHYADMYPEHTGNIVLDSPVNPALSFPQQIKSQAFGFENALGTYLNSCLSSQSCDLPETPTEATDAIRDQLKKLDQKPVKSSDGRLVTGNEAAQGIMHGLSSTDRWYELGGALEDALKDNYDGLLALSDQASSRTPEGRYNSNTIAARQAISCSDHAAITDKAELEDHLAQLEVASPTFGRYLAGTLPTCAGWQFKPTENVNAIQAPGVPPILVLGTTGDPVAPYNWAIAVAEELQNASLLSWKNEGHGAYGKSSRCMSTAVDDFFLSGKLPVHGSSC